LTPVIGVSTAALFLGEPFGAHQVAAVTLTIAGLGLMIRRV
jgi:drug/metabolite transporter (DMT)-like permease